MRLLNYYFEASATALKKLTPSYFYHLAEPANLPSIRKHGLLSTERLLALAKMPQSEQVTFLGRHRPESIQLTNGVIIRDQKPMPPESLSKALPKGMPPSDWYRLLNRYVFLWADFEQVERHRRAFDGNLQALLIFDAPLLLDQLKSQIHLSPINSGNARRQPALHTPDLFVPYRHWSLTGWPVLPGQNRKRTSQPAEIVIAGHLPLNPFLVEIRSL